MVCTACSEGIKSQISRLRRTETPICGRHLRRSLLRRRHLAGPAIPSSAGNSTCGGFAVSSTCVCSCVHTCACGDNLCDRNDLSHGTPQTCLVLRKTPEVDIVFDVARGYFLTKPLNYAISFCHSIPGNTRPLQQRASNQLNRLHDESDEMLLISCSCNSRKSVGRLRIPELNFDDKSFDQFRIRIKAEILGRPVHSVVFHET